MNMFFKPKLFTTFKDYSAKKLIEDVVAGIIVAIIALPLSIALAIASGVGPEKGLYTAIIAGFIISAFGGSRVNISGPTAAFATIVAGIVAREGLEGLVIATILAGLILIVMGLLRLGSLIKYIPYTITTGFTAGIAVTIVIGQIKDFLGLSFGEGVNAVETTEKIEAIIHSITSFNLEAFLVGLGAVLLLIVWPKISKKIPGSLIAVLLGAGVVALFGLNVNTIGDLYQISASFPAPSIPGITFERVTALLPDAFTIAILAAIESLLSCVVSDGMIGDRHNSNTELIAQGLGNVASGIFGGIPATGAIARTAANVKNGGRSPIAGMVHAVVLLLVLLILMPLAAYIPMPVIAAILFIVAYNMSEWRRFVHIVKTAEPSEILVLVATFVLTVVFDLVVAIAVGLVLVAFIFMKKMADTASVRMWDEDGDIKLPKNTVVFEISGPMFFAASDKFLDLPRVDGVKVMILRASGLSMLDSSTVRNLEKIINECFIDGIVPIFSHVKDEPLSVMKKSGIYDRVGAEYFCANINEAIAKAQTIVDKIDEKSASEDDN